MQKPRLEDTLTFSRKERSAIIILIVFIILVVFGVEIGRYLGVVGRTEVVVPDFVSIDSASTGTQEIPNEGSEIFIKIPLSLDINKATAAEFTKLNGIGPVLSERIVKYRESIGGFNTIDDLSEVYGIKPEVFSDIRPQLNISKRKVDVKKEVPKEIIREKPKDETVQIIVDINTADSTTFSQLEGLSPRISGTIVNYRDMIGGFDSMGHINKVYGIDDELFKKIEKSLIISEYVSKEKDQSKVENLIVDESFDFDINTASASDLEKIRGIGPFYSNAIVELRSKLGGFAQMNQLKSLYKIDSTTYDALVKNCAIKTPHEKFDINNIEFKELLAMKILSYEEVQYIFNLKKSLGKITSTDQLLQLQGIPKSKMNLLLRYIEFSE